MWVGRQRMAMPVPRDLPRSSRSRVRPSLARRPRAPGARAAQQRKEVAAGNRRSRHVVVVVVVVGAEVTIEIPAQQAKPSQAKPSQAKPSQAKPSQAKPSQTAAVNYRAASGPMSAAGWRQTQPAASHVQSAPWALCAALPYSTCYPDVVLRTRPRAANPVPADQLTDRQAERATHQLRY
jgi:hypothetical protein